jgi:hypothetical protein
VYIFRSTSKKQKITTRSNFFCKKQPERHRRNAIEYMATAVKDRPSNTAILAFTEDNTTWGSSDSHRQIVGRKDPLDEDEQPQADKLKGSGAIPMAKYSGGILHHRLEADAGVV